MRRWRAWLGALIPALAGLGLAVLFQSSRSANILFAYEVDLGTALLLVGLLVSIVSLGFVATSTAAQSLQQRAIEEERKQAAEAHRRFIRRLDHELKNPLTAMRIGLADLSSAPLKAEQQKMVAGVVAQEERLGRLAADLRKLAELETRPLECSAVAIGPLLEEVMDLIQGPATGGARKVTLSVPRAPWPLPPVPGDRDLIFLAVCNLVDNALKFTRDGDTIEIRASEDGIGVVIEVADTGLGVPEEEEPHIFEELYRGQQARGFAGSGLGLALVKAVAERHGGSVTMRSRTGQGSVFSLRLPTGSA